MKWPANKQMTVFTIFLCALMLVNACGQKEKNNGGKYIVQKADKKIVVLEKKQQVQSQEIEIERIQKLEGVKGLDWLSEERLIIMKPNVKLEPAVMTGEGKKRRPNNLFIRDLLTGKDEVLHADEADQHSAVLSQDKKYLYFKRQVEEMTTGYIMNLTTRDTIQTGKMFVGWPEANWADNEQVLFATEQGDIARADIYGNNDIIVPTKDFATSNIKQIGSKIYYIGKDFDLFEYDLISGKRKLVEHQAIWLIPSPNNKQFAFVRRLNKSEREELRMELVITDGNFRPLKSIAAANQVFGAYWSPDGTKLAYTLRSGGNVQGVYVADIQSGKVTQLAVDADYNVDALRWSPLGDKILMSTTSFRENDLHFRTYIIRLK